MFGALFASFVTFTLFSYFILKPVVDYFRDPKGLRRYPSLNRFSAFTDLAFIWEAHQGFRSKALLEIHKTHPVVRIGPNSLSYGDVKAIKVRQRLLRQPALYEADGSSGYLWPQHQMP